MNKALKYIIHGVVAILGAVIFYNGYSAYLDSRIEALYQERQAAINHASGLPEKDKGNILLGLSMRDCKLLIMGSSELGSSVPENPKNLFPNTQYESDASFTGHAGVQNALHAINLGANADSYIGKDIAIVESLQWYEGEGRDGGGFFANFSELQFYQFLMSNRISEENKRYLCNRYIGFENARGTDIYTEAEERMIGYNKLEQFYTRIYTPIHKLGYDMVNGDLHDPETYFLARMYVADNPLGRAAYYITSPYYWFRGRILILKDKYKTYSWLKGLSAEEKAECRELDWDEIYTIAEQEGIEACTNNDYYINDESYDGHVKDALDNIKKTDHPGELFDTYEWGDYEFFLNVCDDLDIHPYIIAMSTNGYYYDCKMTKDSRDELYDRIEAMALEYGNDCLNLKNYEYEPYFYYDVMHLGWKGWSYVTENIIKHYAE